MNTGIYEYKGKSQQTFMDAVVDVLAFTDHHVLHVPIGWHSYYLSQGMGIYNAPVSVTQIDDFNKWYELKEDLSGAPPESEFRPGRSFK